MVECGGLENRCPPYGGPGVRIPLPPQIKKRLRQELFIFDMTVEFFSVSHVENKNSTKVVSAFFDFSATNLDHKPD